MTQTDTIFRTEVDIALPDYTNLVGIHNMSNEAYHAGPGVSKTGLWTLHKRTPAHFKGAIRKETKAKNFGAVTHMSVLEPHLLEQRYAVVPANAPRRPTEAQWKAAKPSPESQAAMAWWTNWNAETNGKTDLSLADWDAARTIRDTLHADPLIQKLVKGAQFEQSAYAIEPTTGELVRARPDIYSPSLSMMADVKTCRDASDWGFAKAIEEYGYHVQDAFYSDVWEMAGGGAVDAFVFIAIESEAPYVFQIYELAENDKVQGREIYQKALARFSECKATNNWPGYGDGVHTITRPKWAHDKVGYVPEFSE